MSFVAVLTRVFLVICSFFILSSAKARDWAVIEKSGVIHAATEGVFPPFNYVENKKLTGLEVELAEAIAKKLGVKMKWNTMAFDALIPAAKSDRVDFVISGHAYTEDRAKVVDFANPHVCSGAQIIGKKGNLLTAQSLAGKQIAVQMSTSYFDEAKKIKDIRGIKTYRSDPDALEALLEGKADAWISDKWLAKLQIDQHPSAMLASGEQLSEERLSILLKKNNPLLLSKINQALAELTKEGFLLSLSQKYLHGDATCK